jgi:leader peptidase (prepilin peptidase) / N-methyltransferase
MSVLTSSAASALRANGPAWLLAAAYLSLAVPVLWAGPRTWQVILPTVMLGGALVALSAIDLATLRLPDAITLPLIAAGLLCATLLEWDTFGWRLAAAALGYGVLYGVAAIYLRLRGRHGLGLGDAKLLAASGTWLGIEGVPAVLLVSSASALAAALAGHWTGRPITAATKVPFGPFIAGATWLVWLYGPFWPYGPSL